VSGKVLWSGRFGQGAEDSTLAFTSSISVDQRMAWYDIVGSIAHAKMLARQKIIDPTDGEAIVDALKEMLVMLEGGQLPLSPQFEDIHSNIEFLLTEKVKEAGPKLHTARSRNDQVVTDLRMYLRDKVLDLIQAIMELETALLNKASDHISTIMPGFTHMQHAQPITLGHHLLAHFFRLQRDADRLVDAYKRLNICPLGSAALAGTTYNIDRLHTTALLGFKAPSANSIDGVSSRDFVAELMFACSMCMVNLSSLCEELVIWSTPEFGFAEIADAFATGSSIMPQKKNPDVAELIRGKSAKAVGDLTSLLVLLKSMP